MKRIKRRAMLRGTIFGGTVAIGLPMLDAGIEIFLVFADDDDVHSRMFRADKRVERDARSDVRVEAERLPSSNVNALEA